MTNCQKFEKQLTAYLHGELSPSDFQTLETHLTDCDSCRAELEALRATLALLGDALAAAPAPEQIVVPPAVEEPVWVKKKSDCTRRIPMLKVHVVSISIAAAFMGFLFIFSASFVMVSIEKKHADYFCPPPPVLAKAIPLKKLTVKASQTPRRTTVTTRMASASQVSFAQPDIQLPEVSGMGGGLGNITNGFDGSAPAKGQGLSSMGAADRLGFEASEVDFFGGKRAAEKEETRMEPSPSMDTAQAPMGELAEVRQGLAGRTRGGKVDFDDDLKKAKKPEAPVPFNPYVMAEQNAFSTFSIDVDTASYGLARQKLLDEHQLPEPETVRTEEFINSFDYDYRPPAGKQTFAVHREMAPSPFRPGFDVLKIGVKGRRIGRDDHRGAVLTLVIDTSGSMSTPERLGLIKQSLALLIDQLSPTDEVAIVQFGNEARLVCEHTPASEKETLMQAIQSLQPGGPTQFDSGLQLGYQQATAGFRAGDSNRILILSDGVANVGELDPDALLEQVAEQRKKGIYLSVLGFGAGTYDDDLLEKLANRGDGQYVYIDTLQEARRQFVDQLAATLHVIASDVKIQVEFNPERVLRYRQLGYENRQLTKEQFRDDTVDAGEVGSGQSVTALYDVQLKPGGPAHEPIATVYVRYCRADNGDIEEISSRVTDAVRAPSFEAADVRFQLAVCVAEFAEHLRRSPYAEGTSMADLVERMLPVVQTLDLDEQVQELRRLILKAENLER